MVEKKHSTEPSRSSRENPLREIIGEIITKDGRRLRVTERSLTRPSDPDLQAFAADINRLNEEPRRTPDPTYYESMARHTVRQRILRKERRERRAIAKQLNSDTRGLRNG